MRLWVPIVIGLLCVAPALAGELETARERLAVVEAAYADATNRLAAAELDAALARTRMASHTGALLSRELKKVRASARLVEITRKTGRSEELARYEGRHQMLLDAIDHAVVEYQMMVKDLCAMRRELVESGFADYEKRLVEMEVADQIKVNNRVKAHYDAFCAGDETSLEQWKKELEEL